jgi:hypothetical protein
MLLTTMLTGKIIYTTNIIENINRITGNTQNNNDVI